MSSRLKELLALAWPVMLSRMSQSVIGLSDVWLVSDLGAAAVAATSIGAMNAFALLILPIGVMFVVSSFASQFVGRGDVAGARRFAWYGLLIAALTQALSVATLPLVAPVLGLLPIEPDVQVLMSSYLAVRLLGGGAAVGMEALASYFGGLGRTLPGMVASLVAMVLNVVGNLVLIEGRLGAPRLGVTGSALASTLATSLAFLGFFVFFLAQPKQFGRAPWASLKLAEFGRLLRFGLPSGVNWLFEFLAFLFFVNVVMAGLGTPALAAMNTVLTINSVSFMPTWGLASAGAILVGQAIGSKQKDLVPPLVGLTVRSGIVWQAFVGVLYVTVPHVLLQPFARGPEAQHLLDLGTRMLLVSAAWQAFDATATVLAEALRAAGDTVFPLVVRLGIAWALFAPGSWVSVRHFGWSEVGGMLWLAGYLALLAVVLYLRYRSGRWRNIELIEPTLDG